MTLYFRRMIYLYHQKGKSIKNFLLASWRSLKEQDPEPDPVAQGTDPRVSIRIRIRTKMPRIRNTGCNLQNLGLQKVSTKLKTLRKTIRRNGWGVKTLISIVKVNSLLWFWVNNLFTCNSRVQNIWFHIFVHNIGTTWGIFIFYKYRIHI